MKNYLFLLKKVQLLLLAMTFTLSSCNLDKILDRFLGDDDDYDGFLSSEFVEPEYEVIDYSEFDNEPYAEYAAKYIISDIDGIGSVELFGDGSFVILPSENGDPKAEAQLADAVKTRSTTIYMLENMFYAFGEYTSNGDGVYYLEGIGTMTVGDYVITFDFNDWQYVEPPHFSGTESKYYKETPKSESEFVKALCRRWVIVGISEYGRYCDYDIDYDYMVYEFGYESYIECSRYGTYMTNARDEYGWDIPDVGEWEILNDGRKIRYYTGFDSVHKWVEANVEFVRYKDKPGRYMRLELTKIYIGDNDYVNINSVVIFK